MNILYVAFPCNPYAGSESKIGWNIPVASAQMGNNVLIVTIKDMQNDIEDYLKKNYLERVDIEYIDIPQVLKKILKKFSTIKLKLYHMMAIKKIRRIIKDGKKIDIIHQITPVEFRSIGNYYKIRNVKVIVGPVGGGEYIPKTLKYYGKNKICIEVIRRTLNLFEKIKLKINRKKLKYTKLLFANKETMEYLKMEKRIVMPEVGVLKQEINNRKKIILNDNIVFIVSGRLVYRKGHELLLNVLKNIQDDVEYKVIIIGDGREAKNIKEEINNDNKLKKHVEILGKIKYEDMKKEYDKADVLIMPSLRETTGSVILEAMANGLAVIAMNSFGAKLIINNSNGYLYDGTSKEEIESSLKQCIISCITNKIELLEKKKKAIEDVEKYTFENKMKKYNNIYRDLLICDMEEKNDRNMY